jgi:hypothetical protein
MNETTRVLDGSHIASTSDEKGPTAAEYDVRIEADAAPRTYKALPRRPGQPNFMDFFTPRLRPPTDQAVARYKALTKRPTDLSGAECPAVSEVAQASPDQPSEEIVTL